MNSTVAALFLEKICLNNCRAGFLSPDHVGINLHDDGISSVSVNLRRSRL